jgi:hypothetical protein
MPKFDPAFAVKALNDVSPGAPVIFKTSVAFAGLNRSGPPALVTLAVHDAATSRFVYRYFEGGQPNVLVPSGDIIIRPKLNSFTINVSLQPTTNLYHGDAPYLVVELPQAGEFRLLNLKDGSLVRALESHMDAFTSWEVGVMSMGAFVPLLKV